MTTRGVPLCHAVVAELHALDDAQAAIARGFDLTFRPDDLDYPGEAP